jgi:thioredoxin-related protein
MNRRSFSRMRLILATLFLPLLTLARAEIPYQPETNALAAYAAALETAKAEGKHLWVQIGEPDCPACQRFYWFLEAHPETSGPLHKHFVPLHLALSRENIPLFRQWNSPHIKHGVPVILILDATGQILTLTTTKPFTASVGEFSETQIAAFLLKWAPPERPIDKKPAP